MPARLLHTTLLVIAITLLSSFSTVTAQFLTLEIEVEPEVGAAVERTLDFGQIFPMSGIVEFNLGDPGMGVFSIRAIRTQRLLVSIDTPDFLTHQDVEATIPIALSLAATDFGVDDYRLAEPLLASPVEIELSPPPDRPQSEWSAAFFYVYGWIDVGNVPDGVYTGEVVLNVEYE